MKVFVLYFQANNDVKQPMVISHITMLLDITDQMRFCYMISRLLRLNFESSSDVMTPRVMQKVASQLHLLNNSPIYTECACGTYPLPYG